MSKPSKRSGAPLLQRLLTRLLAVALPLLIIVGAVVLAKGWIANMPERPKAAPHVIVPQVDLVETRARAVPVEIRSEGTVEPLWEATLAAQVAGKVLTVSPAFQPGRRVAKGDPLLTLERTEYEGALARARAEVSLAQQRLAEERVRGEQARREWRRTGRNLDDAPELTLRLPQLAAAEASLQAATSAVATASLNLERTTLRAPFDALVDERLISPGDVAQPGQPIGRLIGIETFQVPLVLTPFQAAGLVLPIGTTKVGDPLFATLRAPARPGAAWTGVVTRVDARVDPRNRFVYAICEVTRPLDDPARPLRVGTFVEATLIGRTVPDLHAVPVSALVDDRRVWSVVPPAETASSNTAALVEEPAERVFAREGLAYLRLDEPTRPRHIVVQPLPSFRPGMRVMPIPTSTPNSDAAESP